MNPMWMDYNDEDEDEEEEKDKDKDDNEGHDDDDDDEDTLQVVAFAVVPGVAKDLPA